MCSWPDRLLPSFETCLQKAIHAFHAAIGRFYHSIVYSYDVKYDMMLVHPIFIDIEIPSGHSKTPVIPDLV